VFLLSLLLRTQDKPNRAALNRDTRFGGASCVVSVLVDEPCSCFDSSMGIDYLLQNRNINVALSIVISITINI
jgi:hypothetical protein